MHLSPSNVPLNASGKLLLVDGMNIVRRIYEAIPGPDSKEKAESAVLSAQGSLIRGLTEHSPTHALVAFDIPDSKNWRHDLYSSYHAGRRPMAPELREQLPRLFTEIEDHLHLKTLSLAGFEADDLIASALSRWGNRGPAVILSTDKDLCQLIRSDVLVRDHFKPQTRDAAWVHEKFGVAPALLGDLLALAGDSTDNIPGVRRVGVKTAATLLAEHGSLEAVLAAAPSIKGKLGESLTADADLARLSRQLVALKSDVQLGLTWAGLRIPQKPVR